MYDVTDYNATYFVAYCLLTALGCIPGAWLGYKFWRWHRRAEYGWRE